MRARTLLTACAGLTVLLAAACSPAAHPASRSPSSPAPSSPAPAARASGGPAGGRGAASGRFLACLAANTGGIGDRSFNAASWQGLRAAQAAEPGTITVRYLPAASGSDYTPNIDALVRRRCGIIVTVGLLMANDTAAAAKASPGQKFAIVDYAYRRPARNIDALAFSTVQSAFLGGYLAAGMSKTGVVGTFGGQQLAPVTSYLDGYADGVQYYDARHHARVRVIGWSEKAQRGLFTDTFTGQASGRVAAQALISAGADVIFPVAGSAGLSAARAVQAADAAAGRDKITMEWADTDGCVSVPGYCRYFITSVTKNISQAVRTAVLAAARGRFTGGTHIGTLASGGVALAGFHDFARRVPAGLRSELAQIRAEIISGKIVPATRSRL